MLLRDYFSVMGLSRAAQLYFSFKTFGITLLFLVLSRVVVIASLSWAGSGQCITIMSAKPKFDSSFVEV